MQRDTKITAVLSILLFLLLVCCGFLPSGGEITSFEIVRVLGIDKHGDGVEVTLIAGRAKPSPGEEGGGMSYEVMSESGPTAFEAVAKLRSSSDKRQVFGYVDYIIFGENTAQDNFSEFADFPARNPEIRYSPKVFIARETTAKELINSTSSGDIYLGDSLDNLSKNVNIRSDFSLLKNIELMNMLDKHHASAAVIPAVTCAGTDSGKHSVGRADGENQPEGTAEGTGKTGGRTEDSKLIGGEMPEKKLFASGYAVIRDFKLAGYLDASDARAYNLLTGGAKTYSYSVRDDSGAYCGLDVLTDNLKLKPRFRNGSLESVTCTVHLNANIAEQRSLIDIEKSLEGITGRLEAAVQEELGRTVAKSKEYGIDCFGFGERLKTMHPYKLKNLDWREVYKTLDIDIDVDAVIRRVYDLNEPSGGINVSVNTH